MPQIKIFLHNLWVSQIRCILVTKMLSIHYVGIAQFWSFMGSYLNFSLLFVWPWNVTYIQGNHLMSPKKFKCTIVIPTYSQHFIEDQKITFAIFIIEPQLFKSLNIYFTSVSLAYQKTPFPRSLTCPYLHIFMEALFRSPCLWESICCCIYL